MFDKLLDIYGTLAHARSASGTWHKRKSPSKIEGVVGRRDQKKYRAEKTARRVKSIETRIKIGSVTSGVFVDIVDTVSFAEKATAGEEKINKRETAGAFAYVPTIYVVRHILKGAC